MPIRMTRLHFAATGSAALLAALLILTGNGLDVVRAHEVKFSAGVPGDAKKPSRTIEIVMREEYGLQIFEPNRIEVKHGEQIRFVLRNEGNNDHEFMLATTKENLAHAKVMAKHPDREHSDPNGITLKPGNAGEILWRFTRRGTFEYACLFPGHREDGMFGAVVVK
jgi:uncharacterized cupredoxin-like copper-binding protein